MTRKHLLKALALIALFAGTALAQTALPRVEKHNGASTLLINNQPFLILAGELSNSAAGTAAQADDILPRMAAAHVNTIVMPVAWELTEPTEGHFDYSILDHWIEVARTQHIHLVLLWFGSWKNGTTSYAPDWVKRDAKRFPRILGPDGQPREVLSTLSRNNVEADAKAFKDLMRHVKETDAAQQTVVLVQVENEVGLSAGSPNAARDRSPEADRAFAGPVPDTLLRSLREHPDGISPELKQGLNLAGHTWKECFGDNAAEVFTAWHYARYIDEVAKAGKAEYALPMYVNAQLPAPFERPGEYPSGGPHPYFLAVYRAAAPSIDFYSPDIYWPDFEYWCARYNENGNPLFIPEARIEWSPWNALYAYGEAGAAGFSPFDIDSLKPATSSPEAAKVAANDIREVYRLLDEVTPQLLAARQQHRTRGLILHATSARAVRTVSLDGYNFSASLARTYPGNAIAQPDGSLMVLELAPDDFLLIGSALRVTVTRDLDNATGTAGLASVETGEFVNGVWVTKERENGDQNDQGRQIMLPAGRFAMIRVKTYAIHQP